jgi:hypothetical protein
MLLQVQKLFIVYDTMSPPYILPEATHVPLMPYIYGVNIDIFA